MESDELEKIITKVNDVFYDGVYEDPWLKLIFGGVDIDHIKSQQTDFMLGALGGFNRYLGRSPKDAHPHIFIQQDMWDLRTHYLIKAFDETKTPEWIQEKWLAIDEAFKKKILKNDPSECEGRYKTDPIINIPNPNKTKKAA